MFKKRGPYFNYKLNKNSIQIPRQTLWNRKQRIIEKNSEQFIFVPETLCQNNDANADCMEINESESDTENDFEHEEENVHDTESDCEFESDCGESFETNTFGIGDFQPLKNNFNCTKADAMLIIYAFSIRHNLNWNGVEDLVHLVNTIIGENKLCASKYFFKKKFGQKNIIKRTTHFLCHFCEKYLGTEENLKSENVQKCSNCETIICMDTKYKKNHFITIPIKQQIKSILEQNADSINLNSEHSNDCIRDVYDSPNYRRLKKSAKNDLFITLTASADGAAVFKSTKHKSFWPIQFFINEIELKHRFKRKNIICAAFSFGKTPDMSTFLRFFIEEINEINNEGGLAFHMQNGEICKVKVFLFLITADAPAKSDILNKVHHSGRGGCPYCEHNGTVLPGKTQVLYCTRDNARRRDNDKTRADMIEAHCSGNRVNGYHGLSALLALNCEFDMVQQIVIDRMHCIDIGVVKRQLNLFLENKYRGKDFYVGNHIAEIDDRMKQIQLPKLIRRNFRSFSERNYFHAYEYKYIILFILYPILRGILPQRFLNHLVKLIDAIHILSSITITAFQMNKAKQLLLSFVNEFEQLYGEENMVFNVHQLCHISECVENNGPLFLYSTYSMEDHIGHLVSMVKGTTDVCHQICEKYLLEKHLVCYLEQSCIAKKFFEDIQSKLTFPIAAKIQNDIVVGKSKTNLSDNDLLLIRELLSLSSSEQIDEYDSVLWNGEIYYERANKIRKKRTCDTFALNLKSNCFVEIKSIFVVNNQTYFLVDEKFEVSQDPSIISEHVIFLNLIEPFETKVITSTNIGPKYAFVKFGNVYSCSKFPNLYERN